VAVTWGDHVLRDDSADAVLELLNADVLL